MASKIIWDDKPANKITWDTTEGLVKPPMQSIVGRGPGGMPQGAAPFAGEVANYVSGVKGRSQEAQQATESRLGTGETGNLSYGLQTVNNLALAPFAEVTGDAVVQVLKQLPFSEEAGEALTGLAKDVIGSDYGKKIAEHWNSLTDNERANWGSLGNLATTLVAPMKATKALPNVSVTGKAAKTVGDFVKKQATKVVAPAKKIRVNKLNELYRSPPITERAKSNRALDLVNVEDVDMLETLNGIPTVGGQYGSGKKLWIKNIEAISNEIEKMESKLQGKLSKVKSPVRAVFLKNHLAEKFKNPNLEKLLKTDASMKATFDLSKQKLMEQVDKFTVNGSIEAADVLKVRRHMAKLHRRFTRGRSELDSFGTGTAAADDIIQKATLDVLNNVAGTQPDFIRYAKIMQAKNNLIYNSSRSEIKSIGEQGFNLVSSHPFLAINMLTGGLGKYLESPAIIAAAVAGTGVVGANMAVKQAAKYLGPQNIPQAVQGATNRATGLLNAVEAPVGAFGINAAMRPQEQQNGQP